ncbi:MAG TPA: ribbon-helix-helix domain-containing protein, partial [Thermoanaerobaculia bacterium]
RPRQFGEKSKTGANHPRRIGRRAQAGANRPRSRRQSIPCSPHCLWETMTVGDTQEMSMPQVSARFPAELVDEIDRAANRLHRTRAELIRQAVEYYLDDVEDLQLGLERLLDPSDPILNWEDVKCELLEQDQS